MDYVADYIFDKELVLLSEDGANITDRKYPVCFIASGKYWVNNHAHVRRAKEHYNNYFIVNAMERKDYSQYNTGIAMPKLNKKRNLGYRQAIRLPINIMKAILYCFPANKNNHTCKKTGYAIGKI